MHKYGEAVVLASFYNNNSQITRLAPSPTGALHLGNARTFLLTWLWARRHGARVVFRMEDLDGPRVKAGADAMAVEDLRWLGLDWDVEVARQSKRAGVYQRAVEDLLGGGKAYGCVCSRKEMELAGSAPHAGDGAGVYPGTCRGRFATIEAARAVGSASVRFAVGGGVVEWEDLFAGRRAVDVARDLGDFVIAKADGTAAYQLAVVVDDAESGVTDVIRGDDLLESAARQLLLYEAMGLGHWRPRYMHLPLVVGEDGRRLAKRHGDTRLGAYRGAGVSAGRARGLVAAWCGWQTTAEPTMEELLGVFDLASVPKVAVVMGQAEDGFLRGRAAKVNVRLCANRTAPVG